VKSSKTKAALWTAVFVEIFFVDEMRGADEEHAEQ